MNIRIDIFNEIPWPQFRQLKEVAHLSEQDKIKHYNFYLEQLNTARFQNWYNAQPKGPRKEIQITGVLLQENLFDLLQEDGFQIYITNEVIV